MAACRDNIDAVMHRRAVSPDVWIAPTLLGNWAYFGAPYNTPGYYLDVTNRVWLRGLYGVLPTIGTSAQAPASTLFTLPAGYVPQAQCVMTNVANITTGVYTVVRIDVLANGNVTFQAQESGASVVWLSLDGLSFSVN